jgi:hypothetical protein
MAEENKTPIVIRTQVYLNDPDYFCNKSWTMSYNLNTKSWISFHSYIPNFYIGENNFFYSGLNGCCDDNLGTGFQAVAGVLTNKPALTTTTTTFTPPPSTTTTTTTLDCGIDGRIIITDCNLDGTAVITVPATTTTTICQRPSSLTTFVLIKGYTLGTDPEVIFTATSQEACDAISPVSYVYSAGNTDSSTVNKFNVYTPSTIAETLEIGNILYYGEGTDCIFVKDGYYICESDIPFTNVYHVSGGVVIGIVSCDCGTTSTTTTMVPDVTECCGILFSSDNSIYYSNRSSTIPELNLLDVPGYASSLGIAMTANYLWSIDGLLIQQWDIALSPFSATYNTSINLPVGYSPGYGIVAKNDGILISTDTSVSPNTVNELDVTGATAVATTIFSLQADRVSTSNMLYTTDGKLIVVTQDGITSDYYITQYDYATGTIEVDLNIGTVAARSLYECDCEIYVTDELGNLYTVIKIVPYVLFDLGVNIDILPVSSATQVASCVVSSITDDTTTTTTSSSSSTTTTTTTTP